MPRKKKYQQSISAPYFEPTRGSKFVLGLEGLIDKLFGEPSVSPAPKEIIEYHLTQREREVAYLSTLGFTPHEIADSLGISSQVVLTHLGKVLHKLELENVSELWEYFRPGERP